MNRNKSALELKRIWGAMAQRKFKEKMLGIGKTEVRGLYATAGDKVKIKTYAKSIEKTEGEHMKSEIVEGIIQDVIDYTVSLSVNGHKPVYEVEKITKHITENIEKYFYNDGGKDELRKEMVCLLYRIGIDGYSEKNKVSNVQF